MSRLLSRRFWIVLLISSSLSSSLLAQRLTVDVYRVRVTTKTGEQFRGILNDVNDTDILIGSVRNRYREGAVPLSSIRKVAIRRINKKSAIVTGAILGGLLTGYLSNQSLQKNQPNSPVLYGLTLTFAAAGGAAGGLLVGAAVGNLTKRVIRPLGQNDPELSLFRQLEPFSIRYQQDFINRLPKTN